MAAPIQNPVPLEAGTVASQTSYSTTTTNGGFSTGGFATPPTAGNTVIIVNIFEDVVTVPTVACTCTDSLSNIYTLAGSANDGVETRIDVWYRQVTTSGQAGAQNITIGIPTIDQPNGCETSTQLIELPGLWLPRPSPGSGGAGVGVATLNYTGGPWSVGDWLLAVGVLQFSGSELKTCASTFSGPETVSTIYQENVNSNVQATGYQYVASAAHAGAQTIGVTGNTGTDQNATLGMTVAFFLGSLNSASIAWLV